MMHTRRDFGKIALAAIPFADALANVNSKFGGVQIGAITYSFRETNDLDAIIKMMVRIGLGEAELSALFPHKVVARTTAIWLSTVK